MHPQPNTLAGILRAFRRNDDIWMHGETSGNQAESVNLEVCSHRHLKARWCI